MLKAIITIDGKDTTAIIEGKHTTEKELNALFVQFELLKNKVLQTIEQNAEVNVGYAEEEGE